MKPNASPVGTEYKPTKLPMGVSGGNGGGAPPASGDAILFNATDAILFNGTDKILFN